MKRARYETPEEVRFLTFSCWHCLPVLNSDWAKDIVVDQLSHLRKSETIGIFAFCVMPDHAHLLVRVAPGTISISMLLSKLKARSSRKILAKLRASNANLGQAEAQAVRESRVWQRGGGYDRNIHSGQEFLEKANYIEQNPVNAGLCKLVEEYRWSSAASVVLGRDPW